MKFDTQETVDSNAEGIFANQASICRLLQKA